MKETLEAASIEWQWTIVDDRPARYGRVGHGPPVVFLPGWGLSGHTYEQALLRASRHRVTVWAPALPGFGETAALPETTLPAYAAWVGDFLDAVGVNEPVMLMGHSFGGGIAIQVAHDLPRRVRSLVLVNSIGGPVPDRPWWDWSLRLPLDVLRPPRLRMLPAVIRDCARNFVRSPLGMARAAALARSADLTAELAELRRRRLPIVVLWGQADQIIARDSLDALLEALGNPEPVTVPGSHLWMVSNPDDFGAAMTNVLELTRRRRWRFPRLFGRGGTHVVPARPNEDAR
jgi:pimeloyl-ACP methyl ester carboxylesterase